MNAILWWMFQNSVSLLLLVPVAWLICRGCSRRPAVQHFVWFLILAKFAWPPLVTWSVDATFWQPPVRNLSAPRAEPDVSAARPASAPFERGESRAIDAAPVDENADRDLIPGEPRTASTNTAVRAVSKSEIPARRGRLALIAAFVVWMTGVVVAVGRQVRTLVRQAAWIRGAQPAPVRLIDQLASVARRLQMTSPDIVVLAGIPSPFVWCVGRARIVWPAEMLAEADTPRFWGIMAHELAHLRRSDHWVAWLELATSCVWWWNPLFWFVRRQLRETAEMACDALALGAELATPRQYAEVLLAFSVGSPHPPRASVLVVGAGSVVAFERRLKMILADHVSSRVSRPALAVLLAGSALLVPCWAWEEPARPQPAGAAAGESTGFSPPIGPADPAAAGLADEAGDPPTVDESPEATDEPRAFDGPIVNVSGVVVDPEGRPVGNALLLQGTWGVRAPRVVGRTDSDGTYTVQLQGYKPWLVAVAAGFGFGTSSSEEAATIQLVPDVPVRGRVIDHAGQPVAGATIRVRDVHWPWHADDPIAKLADRDDRPAQRPKDAGQGLDPWLAAVRRAVNSGEYRSAGLYLQSLIGAGFLGNRPAVYARMISPVATDAEGRFTLRGIGAERVVELYVDGLDDQASSLIVAVTREIETPIIVPYNKPDLKRQITNPYLDLPVYGASFQTALAPGRVLTGTVTDRETGLPVAGVKIIGDVVTALEYPGFDRFFATTDQQGGYRIAGFPTGLSRDFVVEVPATLSFFGRKIQVRLEPGVGPQQRDIPLAKCLWITGRVVDASTGAGVSGATIEYHVFKSNPHLQRDLQAGYTPQFGPDHRAEYTDHNGRFRIRGYPGRGIVSALSYEYLQGIGADAIPGLKKREYEETLFQVGGFSPEIRSTTIETDIPEDADDFDCEVPLLKGKTRTVIVDWPEDEVLGNLEASGLNHQVQNPMTKLSKSQFDVRNLFANERREVVARYVPAKLTGMAVVTEADDGPVTLTLVPWATLTGRLVDEQGQPQSQGFRIRLQDYQLPLHTVNGRNYDKEDFGIEATGRFELIGLIPGAKYRLQLLEGDFSIRGDLTEDFSLEPGENRDLGDVRVLKKRPD